MDTILAWLKVNVLNWLTPPKTIEIIDLIQILLISYFIYHLILWMKNTRAYTLLRGILLIIAVVILANVLHMEAIAWLIGNFSVVAITAVLIIFQPELRKALEQVGHKSFLASFLPGSSYREKDSGKRFSDHTINELVQSCYEMGAVKTGALIVLERDIHLDEYRQTGIELDAIVSAQLLINIFEKNTPLHDGAIIIRGDRVAEATCYLPLSDNLTLSKSLGTRHRAGIGISEVSDSFTIIVSEETGRVSYASDGKIHTGISRDELTEFPREDSKSGLFSYIRNKIAEDDEKDKIKENES
jgi:diadenylate cyclase